VDVTEGRALAKKFDIPFLEVSAKLGDNIEAVFETIAREIKKKNLDSDQYGQNQGVKLNQPSAQAGCTC